MTKRTSVPPATAALCPRWRAFLARITDGDAEFESFIAPGTRLLLKLRRTTMRRDGVRPVQRLRLRQSSPTLWSMTAPADSSAMLSRSGSKRAP
jgi:hypothetical protein